MKIELLREGYLVKGTSDIEKAKLELGVHAKNIVRWEGGTYRKVPGQWSPYNIYKATPGPGAFEAVIGYLR